MHESTFRPNPDPNGPCTQNHEHSEFLHRRWLLHAIMVEAQYCTALREKIGPSFTVRLQDESLSMGALALLPDRLPGWLPLVAHLMLA